MVFKALYRHRDHFALTIISPGAADFLGLEGVIFRAMAVNHFDIATSLLGPQPVGADLGGEQCAEQAQGP